MGYSGQFYGAAWSILERRFGRPHVIIDAQLESLRKASQLKPHYSTGLISFSVIVLNFANVLKEYKQIGDLQSSSILYLAVDKLPQVLKEKWWFYVGTNRDKLFSKTMNFRARASSNVKETKQMQIDQCPLADGNQKIWNCPLFRNMSVNDRYAVLRKQRLCYGCLGKGMQSKIVKSMCAVSMDASRSTTDCNTQKNKWTRAITQST